ncbi:hypothetical protein FB45DRAFT_179086 [Roridomyces roridus]|uniref:F-box domain-containing protein n=1 Tax=Roridomyces roridus TaxID=1738132 RepID=A0AAD7CDX7_9AGAR|nr:hypothetical protein FB45DRAFT_179086 [Roridomyces roridus]
MTTMASLLSLPPEICSSIIDNVNTSLAPLCRVSHSFRDQAQRKMYHSVDLRDCSMRLVVQSWCLAVTRSPHLADRVWALILQLPNPLEPKDAEILSRAFALCVNLKRLAVHHVPGCAPEDNSQHWIIKGPFHLECFFSTYFSMAYTVVLDHQTHIRVLSVPYASSSATSYDKLEFPNLTAIDAPLDIVRRVSEANAARPLERIQIHHDRSTPDLSSLSRFAPTLKALTIVREGTLPGSTFLTVVDEVLKVFPRLQHFGIHEKERQGFATVHDSLIQRLQQFTSLTTLSLHLCRWVPFLEPRGTGFWSIQNRRQLREFGTRILAFCTTLWKATVVVQLARSSGEQEEIACTVSKERDGSVSAIFDDELEEDSFYAMIFD